MMKKQKDSLLKKIYAVLLVTGMVSNATLAQVLAQEGSATENIAVTTAANSITQDGYTWIIPDTMEVTAGETKYSGITGGGSYLYGEKYSFVSSDEAVATVRAEGRNYSGFYLTGVSEGTANITFTCSYQVTSGGETKSVSGTFGVVVMPAEKYALTVNNGIGSGEYEAGTVVTITANDPAGGKQFDKWEINSGNVTLEDDTSRVTTFTMPEDEVSVTATYKDAAEEHIHHFGQWQHDDLQHWQSCSCGEETGRESHDFGEWVIDREATATTAGTKHRDCLICGFRQIESIPATGSGIVISEVKPEDNAPITSIATPAEELKDMLLTREEKQQVLNGTDIKIVLAVRDAENTVSASDQDAIRQALNGYTVGQYLNIDLYKMIGSARTDIMETTNKIRIALTIPDSLKNVGNSKMRTYAIIRVHDGKAELLADLDDSADTITIETDRFSAYAIVYRDTVSGGNDHNNNDSQNNSEQTAIKSDYSRDDWPNTGVATPLTLYTTLAMITGFTLFLYLSRRKSGMTK